MAITAAQDVAGFGRLGQMKMAKRAEEREERRLGIAESRAAQQHRLGALQIKQMETNLQTVRRQAQLKQGLGLALQNIPEGENQFTTAYNYFMMSGAPDEAMKFMDMQSDRIEKQRKLDPEAAVKTYNDTIGKATGSSVKFVKDDPIKGTGITIADKTGKETDGYMTESGDFKPLPEGKRFVDEEPKRTKTLADLELEDVVTNRFVKEEGLSEIDARLKAQAFIAENKRGKGISITQDAEGRPVIQIGGKAVGGELTKGTKTGIQKELIEANRTYSNMKAVVNKIEDRFLEIPTRIGTKITALKEKWGVGDISREDRQELSDYTDFRREAISSLNEYIKQITGAAMSELEAKRLMKAMPSPGLGMFDGDSPTEFKTKLSGVMESLDRVIARNNYVAKHGLVSLDKIAKNKRGEVLESIVSISEIDDVIDRRGEELESEMRANNPDMDQAELENQIMQTLSEEFGIRF
jgi:hypothetical protein